MTKLRQVCAAGALAMMASGNVLADASASFGIMSDYIFRGVYTSDASAFASIDVETDSGFYIGAWGADIIQGLEYDIYAGYAHDGDRIDWNVGVTGYYATDEAFNSAEEFNIGFSTGFLSIDYALGDFKNSSGRLSNGDIVPQTYEYVGATFAPEVGPYYFLGRTDFHNINPEECVKIPSPGAIPVVPSDPSYGSIAVGCVSKIPGTGADGYWFEIGKDFEIMDGLEFSVAALYAIDAAKSSDDSTSIAVSANPLAEYALVFTLTKTISIGD